MATDLTKPLTPLTADQLITSYTDPTAIANEKDPLKRVLMVELSFGNTNAESLEVQNNITKSSTDSLKKLNAVSAWLNDAASRLQTQPDTAATWIGAASLTQEVGKDDLSPPKTVSDVEHGLLFADPSAVGGTWNTVLNADGKTAQVQMTKVNVQAAQKNAQLKIDTLTSTAQTDQTFTQLGVGRYTTLLEMASAMAKKRADLGDAIIQDFRR